MLYRLSQQAFYGLGALLYLILYSAQPLLLQSLELALSLDLSIGQRRNGKRCLGWFLRSWRQSLREVSGSGLAEGAECWFG